MADPNDKMSADFSKAIEDWRKKHQLREDEPLLLCLELFRIHQEHWDALRQNALPSFSDFRDSLLQLQQAADAVQRHTIALIEELQKHPASNRFISPTLGGLLLTALFSVITGILIGKFIL
jgi:hypothetical protein